ncbi:hypothetical protein EYR40_008380 [Pleurotus pulmonarius]|nr:hypothetical protein EYR40_008380 [Pleurotus pulmonarius]
MVSSKLSSASSDKADDLSVLVAANASLSDSVAALTEQVASLSLTVASLVGHHAAGPAISQSATLVASSAATAADDSDSDSDDHLSYISEPDENYSNFVAITASAPEVAVDPAPAAPPPGAPSGPSSGGSGAANTHHVTDVDPSERWYLVTVGRTVGVFQGWQNVAPLVVGVRGSVFNRQPSQQAGLLRFNEARAANLVRVVV